MRPTDKATADSRSVQSFAIIKNTGHGNFVIGRFHARARNGLSVEASLCTVLPSPQTPLLRFFSEGRGRLYTGYLERSALVNIRGKALSPLTNFKQGR